MGLPTCLCDYLCGLRDSLKSLFVSICRKFFVGIMYYVISFDIRGTVVICVMRLSNIY